MKDDAAAVVIRGVARAAALGFALMVAVAPRAHAEPLPAETCDTLKAEHARLEGAGLRDTLKKGAAWGKANLKPEQLGEVKRFIELDEQLLFRCGLSRLHPLLSHAVEEPEAQAAPQANAAKKAASAPAKHKPKARPKARTHNGTGEAASAAGTDGPAQTQAVKAKPKPKPKPKPKVDDAYRPPPPPAKQ